VNSFYFCKISSAFLNMTRTKSVHLTPDCICLIGFSTLRAGGEAAGEFSLSPLLGLNYLEMHFHFRRGFFPHVAEDDFLVIGSSAALFSYLRRGILLSAQWQLYNREFMYNISGRRKKQSTSWSDPLFSTTPTGANPFFQRLPQERSKLIG
jgi:hypothetical protein